MSQISNIVVPLDFSDVSEAALTRAIAIGERANAWLHLVHAILPLDMSGFRHEFSSSMADGAWERMRENAETDLAVAANRARGAGLHVTETVVEDAPIDAIETTYQAKEGDMIVMGTHGYSGIKHLMLGSVTEKTLRTIHAPVFCVKGSEEKQREPIKKMIVATDFSEPAAFAASFAMDLAEDHGASVEIVHVTQSPTTTAAPYGVPLSTEYLMAVRQAAQKRVKELEESLTREKVSIDTYVQEGWAPGIINERAKAIGADLVVMGTHGHTGIKHVLLGSVAERVVRTAPCSVLTVNP